MTPKANDSEANDSEANDSEAYDSEAYNNRISTELQSNLRKEKKPLKITANELIKIIPRIHAGNIPVYLPLLNKLYSSTIDTLERLSCFIAQTAYESASYNCTAEIASGKIYEGRIDLGNTTPGDGVRFKGRGLIQVTGRYNYQACSLALFNDERLLDNPSLLEQPANAMNSALWYWHKNKLNDICDYPDEWTIINTRGRAYNKFQYLTLQINGGLNGYTERLGFYLRAKRILKNADFRNADIKTMYDYEMSQE